MSSLPSQKRMVMLLSIILFLLFAAGYVFLIQPNLLKMNELKSDIQMKETFIETANKKLQEKVDEEDAVFEIPEKPLTDQVVLDLREAEVKSSSQIVEIAIEGYEERNAEAMNQPNQEENDLSTLIPLTFTVEVEAKDMSSVKSFIDEVEGAAHLYTIERVDIPVEVKEAKAPITFTLAVTTYHKK
ncbi:hypothetical protein [Pseudalkalibacillus sp. SCS-8]|uniref:hypothetical protein n=1 Tax=Pseudalkalibacillus nanhaiensis TaxID=3115291 RepID=UPI0032DAB0C8